MTQDDRPRHFVRFGSHNEQTHFTGDLTNTYEGLVFNANLVAWSSSGIAGFVCEQDLIQKSYFIDPLTHAFQHEPSVLTNDDDEVKPSLRKLVDAFGEPVKSIAGREALVPNDFESADVLNSFTEKVLAFQWDTLHEEARETDAWPILEFQYDNPTFRPHILVAPYLFMRKASLGDWLDINLRFVQAAMEADFDVPVAAQLVISSDLLMDENGRTTLIEAYGDLDTELLLLWIDDFSEHEASSDALTALRLLGNGLATKGKRIINLYGGFYSILLTKSKVGPFQGVCHGPQYGEDRGVVPVGGGLPTARFYVWALHHRVRFADALRLFRKQGWLESRTTYLDNVCSCPQCRSLIDAYGVEDGFLKYGESKIVTFERGGSTVSRKFPLRETQVAATAHYMYSKKAEFRAVNDYDVGNLLEHLGDSNSEFRRTLGDSVAYLSNWLEAAAGLSEV